MPTRRVTTSRERHFKGNIYRLFDGKAYQYYYSYDSLSEARKDAQKFRSWGELVRIIPTTAYYIFPRFHKGQREHIEYEMYRRPNKSKPRRKE